MEFDKNELTTGMVLKCSIIRGDGTLILKKGTVLTPSIVAKIQRMGDVKFQVEETVNETLKEDTKKSLKNFLEDPNMYNMEDVKQNTKKIVEMIDSADEIEMFKYNLEEYKKERDIFSHSINTACFSIILAKMYNRNFIKAKPDASKEELEEGLINLEDIALAGLLHDMGKICKNRMQLNRITSIPGEKSLANHYPGISETPLDEYDEKYASVYSYCLIAKMKEISPKAKLMILLSNEPETGEGCLKISEKLKRRRSNFIYAGKIIHVCDIYDKAMKQAIEGNISFEEVVSELSFYSRNGEVDSEIEQLLINNVPLYPVGTKVQLTNGETAIVRECFGGDLDSYQPVVRTLPFPGRIIDLRDETTIAIQCLYNEERSVDDIVRDQINRMKKNAMDNKRSSFIKSRRDDGETR